jgi:zinc protease
MRLTTSRSRAAVSALAAGLLTICIADAEQWPSSRPPGPLASRPVDFPPFEIKTLSNGLQVLVVLHHEQPSVSFRLLVRAGAMQEPDDKPGVASFAAGLLNQGTKTRSAGDLATSIESAGGLVGVGSGNELSFISGAVIKDRTDLMLSLAADMVQNPAFAQDEMDRRRGQILSSLDVSYDDPDYLASLVFDRLVFGFHPYGRPTEGTRESIRRLTREDLIAFHRAWFVPNNSLLAIVGDMTAAEAVAAAERAFGKWERRDVPASKAIDPPPPTRRVVVIDRPGSAQTEIRVGHIAVPRTHNDFVPLDLAIRILGGEGANRLFGVLRSERGLTYGASADFNAYKFAGDIVAETDTRSNATGEALRLMVDEFARLQNQSVHVDELDGAQNFLAGNFPLTVETPGAIAQQVLAHMFFGLDPSEIEAYRDRVEKVTTMDIQRVAKQFVKPDQLSIVLVGDASVFASQLKAVGFPEFERIPIAELDLNSPTLRRQARQPDPVPSGK